MSLHLFLPKSTKRTNSMFAESLKDIQFPVEKQNLYVRNNLGIKNGIRLGDGSELYIPVGSLSYVGECLINMDDYTVYQIGKHIRYTPTQDLIEQVRTEYGRFTPHIIYCSKDKADISINIYFDEAVPLFLPFEYRPALEISNYHSGRYSPKMTISLYNIHRDLMIRTAIPAFDAKNEINLKGWKFLDNMELKKIICIREDILKLLPKRYQLFMSVDNIIFAGEMTLSDALNTLAEITSKWLETNYELATTTQRKIYDILLTKTIEE